MAKTGTRFSVRRGRPVVLKQEFDHGTKELVAKRAGKMTAEVIDLLLDAALISADQHLHALRFRWLYCVRYGVPTVSAVDLVGEKAVGCGRELSYADLELRYRHLAAHLNKQMLLKPLLDTILFNHPGALRDTGERERVHAGLNELIRLWKKCGSVR